MFLHELGQSYRKKFRAWKYFRPFKFLVRMQYVFRCAENWSKINLSLSCHVHKQYFTLYWHHCYYSTYSRSVLLPFQHPIFIKSNRRHTLVDVLSTFLPLAPCKRLGSPANGRITQQGFRHNENIEFECNRDYYLEGSNVLRCSNGKWSSNSPTCLGTH